MNLDQLRERAEEIKARLRAIDAEAGDNDLTEEQADEWRKLETELETVNTDIKAKEEERARRRAKIAEIGAAQPERVERGDAKGPEVMKRVVPWDGSDVLTLTRAEARDRALKALELRERGSHLESEQVDKVAKLIDMRSGRTDGDTIARRLLATESDEYRSAFMKLVRDPQPAFTAEEVRAVNEVRAMSVGVDTAGGYGVPVLIDPTIILTAQGSSNPVRRVARVETITTDEWKGVSSAGVTWSFDAEGSEVSDDSASTDQPTVPVHSARGFVAYSIEIGMDYPSFSAEIGRLLAEGYDELQAEAFVSGSGSGAPTGVFSETSITVVALQTDGSLSSGDINKVWSELPEKYRSNAYWLMSTLTGTHVAGLGNNNAISNFTVDLTGMVETIRTRPVLYSDYAPDFAGQTTAGNFVLVGDFRNYLIADRAGMTVELVPHLFGSNRRPTGQRGLFAHARFGGEVINPSGFRLLGQT